MQLVSRPPRLPLFGVMLRYFAVVFSSIVCIAAGDPEGFMILSSPMNARIAWIRLPSNGVFESVIPKTLIDTGFQHPQGIAVDATRKRLYVADPDAQRIYAYQLSIVGTDLVADPRQTVVVSGVESRWVAVDGSGTVFFTDEPNNRILKVPANAVLRGVPATPQVVYTGESVAEVNEPGGLAVDNFNVFWTNKHFGQQAGSLVRGSESPPSSDPQSSVTILAKNTVKSYGVCIAMGNVFFTDSTTSLYGVKKNGGAVTEVSGLLQRPRGCAWDGDGTLYVADRGAGAVYSLPSNMHIIQPSAVTKAFEFEDAFGLAVLAGAHWSGRLSVAIIAMLALLGAMSSAPPSH